MGGLLMAAWALKQRLYTPVRLPNGPIFRMIAYGTLWGLLLSAGLLTLTYYSCGVVCIGDALVTTTLSVVAGIGTIGPMMALGIKG
jgi:hypothetical protein